VISVAVEYAFVVTERFTLLLLNMCRYLVQFIEGIFIRFFHKQFV
jgi:hypothetical protein